MYKNLLPFATLALLGLFALHASAREPERIETASGQTIVKEFRDDGTLKTVTRLHPGGGLLGILHHSPAGAPTHADYYDDRQRVRRTLFYRADGVPTSAREFDEAGRIVLEQNFDPDGSGAGTAQP